MGAAAGRGGRAGGGTAVTQGGSGAQPHAGAAGPLLVRLLAPGPSGLSLGSRSTLNGLFLIRYCCSSLLITGLLNLVAYMY